MPSVYSEQQREKLRELAQSVKQNHQVNSYIIKTREQQARQIELEVKGHLNDLVTSIAAEHTSDISLIQRNYSMEVEHVIRAAATSAYIVGLNYVGGRKKKLHHMFLTVLDIEKIKTITQEFAQIFWRRVNAVMHQKDVVQNILKSARFSPRSSLTLANLVTSLAVKIVTKAIALATVAKVNALRSLPESRIKSGQAVEQLVWTTQMDERVCPLCQSLDGMQWASDDPGVLIPPDDSHDNCRCRLDIAGTGVDVTDEVGGGINPLLPLGFGLSTAGTAIGLATSQADCPEGQIWAPKKKKCQDCQPDQHTDPDTGKCVDDNCPENQHWDDDLQKCVDDNPEDTTAEDVTV
jgi:hypothetical protein